MDRTLRVLTLGILAAALLFYSPSRAAVLYINDFGSGLNTTFWQVVSNQPLYVVDATQGDVRISKPFVNNTTLQVASVKFLPQVVGDFDISVEFHDASITRAQGQPGNQIQLNAFFGGQEFDVVRSDESGVGQNRHVWVDPPHQLQGTASETSLAGTLRITRTGTTVTGYYSGALVFSGSYNNSPVTSLSFSLQNNGTTDATSVTFDNFRLSADNIVFSNPSAVGDGRVPALATLVVSPNPFSSSARIDYHLETAGSAHLEIFDVAGRRAATLFEAYRDPGQYFTVWNGEDEHGVRAPSGVYFARLVFNGGAVTKRLIRLQ